jgi:hypothetical protein
VPAIGLAKPVVSKVTSATLKPVIPPVAWAIGHLHDCFGLELLTWLVNCRPALPNVAAAEFG